MDQSLDADGDPLASELVDGLANVREPPVMTAAASDPAVVRTIDRMMAVMGESDMD